MQRGEIAKMRGFIVAQSDVSAFPDGNFDCISFGAFLAFYGGPSNNCGRPNNNGPFWFCFGNWNRFVFNPINANSSLCLILFWLRLLCGPPSNHSKIEISKEFHERIFLNPRRLEVDYFNSKNSNVIFRGSGKKIPKNPKKIPEKPKKSPKNPKKIPEISQKKPHKIRLICLQPSRLFIRIFWDLWN